MISIYKQTKPFFSIVLCSSNQGKLLNRAIDSVLVQIEKDWELIIVDNGSNDNTHEIAKKYCDSSTNIRYMYHKNKGLALSKNSGILAASGLFITFLNPEDEYLPNHLRYRSSILKQYPELDLIHGGIQVVGNEFVPDKYNKNKTISLKDCVIGSTFCMRRDKFLLTDGFVESEHSEDLEFYSRFSKMGFSIAKTTEETYVYRQNHSNFATNTNK